MSFDALINYRDWIETYQVSFKACKDANVSSFMCSYNEINGIPSCGNYELLTGILRNEWGFDDGYVVSDCGAIPQIYSTQHAVRNYEEASQMAIKAGCDWAGICGTIKDVLPYLHYSIKNGTLPMKYINTAVKRVLPFWFKLGLMDPIEMNPWRNLTLKTLWPAHRPLALEAAIKSMVLLENNNDILPIDINISQYKKWAIVGPCINNTVCYSGDYNAHPPAIITPLIAIEEWLSTINITTFDITFEYFDVCNDGPECANINDSDIIKLENIVNNSDIVIYIGGISYLQEAEGRDRRFIELPSNQSYVFEKLVSFVNHHININININSSATSKTTETDTPIITILTYGAPVIDKFMFNHSNALLAAGYGGEMIGDALVTILNGSYAPSGRTSVTWYQNTKQLPNMTNYDMSYYPGRTYRYLTENPIYSFGFGLSYVEFKYSNLVLSNDNISPCQTIDISFDIENIGNKNRNNYNLAVDHVSQVYLILLNNTVVTDNIRLVNFTKSESVELNQTKHIVLQINPQQMAVTSDSNYVQMIENGTYQVLVGSRLMLHNYTNMLKANFQIVGDTTPFSDC